MSLTRLCFVVGETRLCNEGDSVRPAVGGTADQDDPDSGADVHRPAGVPGGCGQSAAEGGGAAHASHLRRPTLGEHAARQEDLPQQGQLRGIWRPGSYPNPQENFVRMHVNRGLL
jgi:hypothetical protein